MVGKRTYQFRKKGIEAQFDFNTKVEDHIEAVRKELGKSNLPTPKRPRSTKQSHTWMKRLCHHPCGVS